MLNHKPNDWQYDQRDEWWCWSFCQSVVLLLSRFNSVKKILMYKLKLVAGYQFLDLILISLMVLFHHMSCCFEVRIQVVFGRPWTHMKLFNWCSLNIKRTGALACQSQRHFTFCLQLLFNLFLNLFWLLLHNYNIKNSMIMEQLILHEWDM